MRIFVKAEETAVLAVGIWIAIPIGWFLADLTGYGYYFLCRKKMLSEKPLT